jgi:hypothetical protein
MKKTSILNNAQDFIVIGQSGRDSYVYAVKPSLKIMRQFYEQSIANRDDKNVDVFNKYWGFNEKEGIVGSSTFLALRFDKTALRFDGLWLPGLLEGKVLESKGKLEKGVYRDYSIAVYNDGEPNKAIARTLVSQAKGLDLELPLIVPFRALDYNYNTKENGVDVSFVQSPKGIISGKEAQRIIYSFNYQGNSGVRRLVRGRDGLWGTIWDWLDYSDDLGRVDWVCGEATQKILKKAYSKLSERKYGERIRELREEQKSEDAKFKESLKR